MVSDSSHSYNIDLLVGSIFKIKSLQTNQFLTNTELIVSRSNWFQFPAESKNNYERLSIQQVHLSKCIVLLKKIYPVDNIFSSQSANCLSTYFINFDYAHYTQARFLNRRSEFLIYLYLTHLYYVSYGSNARGVYTTISYFILSGNTFAFCVCVCSPPVKVDGFKAQISLLDELYNLF